MSKVILKKDVIEKLLILTKNREIESLMFYTNKGEDIIMTVEFNNKNTSVTNVGELINQINIVFKGNVKIGFRSFSLKSESANVFSFIKNSFAMKEELEIEFEEAKKNISFSCGKVEYCANSETQNCEETKFSDFYPQPNPIVSFSKKEFEQQISEKIQGLSLQNEWVDKKLAGVNLIFTTENAHLFMATKSFYMRSNISGGVFYPETSRTFVHDEGVLFLKEETINNIRDIAGEHDIKIFFGTPCNEELVGSNFFIQIGDFLSFSGDCLSRKKSILNSKNVVEPFLSEKIETEVSFNREEFRNFFSMMKDNPFFMDNVLTIKNEKEKLTLLPYNAEEKCFSYSIKSSSKEDMKFDANFFVFDKTTSVLKGENIIFQTKKSNNKRFIISDGNTWFVVGKIIKKD